MLLTVAAAVFAVALIIAVPVISAVGTDAASFTEGDAGYVVTAKDATDAELSTYGFSDRPTVMTYNPGYRMFSKIFYLTVAVFDGPAITADTYTVKSYEGMKIESEKVQSYDGGEFSTENVKYEYTADKAGELLLPLYKEYGEDYEAAGNAIKAYLGNDVAIGDKLVFTGSIKSSHATKSIGYYASVDDTYLVQTSKDNKTIQYFLYSIDVTISFTHGGETKTISFYSDQKFEVDRVAEIDYKGKAYKDLTNLDKCDITYTDTYYFESGSSYYKVDGSQFKIKNELTPKAPDEDVYVSVYSDSFMQIQLNEVKTEVGLIPAGEGNVTVDKTYAGAESAFSDLASEVALDNILGVILLIVGIIVGIIVIIVILIIVLVVLKKKKKNQ